MPPIITRIENIISGDKAQPLFYTEAGSRLLGISTESSDYDVRGVHLLSKGDYFSFLPQLDSIEMVENKPITSSKAEKDISWAKVPNQLDLVSYEWDKFMNMMLKSNPSVWEFWRSGQFYLNHLPNFSYWQQEAIKWIDYKILYFYYISIAKNHAHLLKKKPSPKVLFYGLRALLCAQVLLKNQLPPLIISELFTLFNNENELLTHAQIALHDKQNQPDKELGAKIQTFFIDWIAKETEKLLSLRPLFPDVEKQLTDCLKQLNWEVKTAFY